MAEGDREGDAYLVARRFITKTRSRLSQHDSSDTLLQNRHIEVHDQAHTRSRQSQIAHDLSYMNRMDLLDRLDFDDDLTIDEQIDSMLAQERSSVLH